MLFEVLLGGWLLGIDGVEGTPTTVFTWSLIGGAAALGLIAMAEMAAKHATRNIAEAVHHLTRGAFAREWWLGGIAIGVVVPVLLGIVQLNQGEVPTIAGAIGGLAAMAGIWFSDDAFVKAGQSVPIS